MSTMVETQTKKAEDNSARNFFLLLVSAFGVNIALLLFDLPEELRNICILWLIVGCPFCFVLMRIWHGYVTLQLANIQHQPVMPQSAAEVAWAQAPAAAAPAVQKKAEPRLAEQGSERLRVATLTDAREDVRPQGRTVL